jgi:hypothetical protein
VTKSEKAAATSKKYRIINLTFLPPMRRERTISRNHNLQRFPFFREIASGPAEKYTRSCRYLGGGRRPLSLVLKAGGWGSAKKGPGKRRGPVAFFNQPCSSGACLWAQGSL